MTHVPTLISKAKVIAFTCAGFSHNQIAKYLEIDDDTLRKHYQFELHSARLDKLGGISETAYARAMDGSERMIEFVLKHQGGWAPAAPAVYPPPPSTAAIVDHIESRGIKVDTDADTK